MGLFHGELLVITRGYPNKITLNHHFQWLIPLINPLSTHYGAPPIILYLDSGKMPIWPAALTGEVVCHQLVAEQRLSPSFESIVL